MNQEKQMTEEEMKKMMEVRKAEWDTFIGKIKDDPSAVVTNAVLEKIIDKSWHERKKIYTIKFDVSNNPDAYSIDFTAGLNGFGNLKIIFSDRELISYYGVIEKISARQK